MLARPAAGLLNDSAVMLVGGAQLGPYQIEAPIGAGGMGEVYRAIDTRLGRAVAIKILHEKFNDRFEREARAISALNHPNVCTLYDIGPNYLVMELLQGETLAARLKKGALPPDLVVRYGTEIADALAAAHGKEIVHRDLKPRNIMVTKSGVKVLDFGLAKAQRDETLTTSRAIMGTPAYMAPEQSEGKASDERTDIYALGLVLREMATGEREGSTSGLPALLANVIDRCLATDSESRWHSATDVKFVLEWAGTSQAAIWAAPFNRPGQGRLSWVLAGVLGLGLMVLGALLWRATRPGELKPLVRLDVDLGPDVALGSAAGADSILSPDGSRLVYVSRNRLFTRRLDQPQATELPETEGAYQPFFSPDGRWVAFFARGKLKKISLAGGAPIVLCNASNGMGGSWGEDGMIVAAISIVGGLFRILPDGAKPAPVTELDRERGDASHRWPQILPGGKAVLFTAHTRNSGGFDDASIEVISLRDRRKKVLMRGGTYARYLPSGHLVYVNRGTLFAVPFDVSSLEIRGVPTPVLNQVAYSSNNGDAGFESSRTGTMVYESGSARGGAVTVQWLESDGKTQALIPKSGNYGRPSLSPDGQRLAMEVSDGPSQDIWVYDLARDQMTRVTFDGNGNQVPIWTPDGRHIVFRNPEGLSWTRADGAGTPHSLIARKSVMAPWSFSPDGKLLAYHDLAPGTLYDLWTVPVENHGMELRAGKPEVFLQTASDERAPAFSPDGHWLAYGASESGEDFQVFVRAFPDNGQRVQISSEGGAYPMWSRTGRELFFEATDNRIMVAGYKLQGDFFIPDKPRLWSPTPLANRIFFSKNVDLAPDGRRIVGVMPAHGEETRQSPNHVIFLENFFDELRRRSPMDGK
jgi:serine/threonine-protein kinase